MTRYRAAWVVPVDGPPRRDAWVEVHEGRVTAVGTHAETSRAEIDLGAVALMPGLVNAHTHLELSCYRDVVPPATTFVSWVEGMMAARRAIPDPADPRILEGIHAGIAQAEATGTALVGDISNTLATVSPLVASRLGGVIFHELIRFNVTASDAQRLVGDAWAHLDALCLPARWRAAVAPHAPYSVAPAVLRAVADAMDARPVAVTSVHMAEGAEETEFLQTGGGPWRRFLERVGSWNPDWQPPATDPVAYLQQHDVLRPQTLAVHGVQLAPTDLARLRSTGATLVTSPRSNLRTGAGTPPVAQFYASGVRVAIGTDSLASTPDLNMFEELALLRRLAPEVPAARLLESATRCGAEALGFGATHGTIAPGRSSHLLVVPVPERVTSVEEFLVADARTGPMRWLDDPPTGAA